MGPRPAKRYSKEAPQQEDQSAAQLRERLAAIGWSPTPFGRDVGEDFHIQIFDDGADTGLTFDVQLKSTKDAERLRRRQGPDGLRYRLDVRDLQHWEVKTTLVVLVIWDVDKRKGYWQTIPRIIEELDKGRAGWRQKQTVTVAVPVDQGTDDTGLKRLRWAIADHSLALVPKRPYTIALSLAFPSTEQGRNAQCDVWSALDKGDRIVLGGDLLREFKQPEWHRRIYGMDYPRPTNITLTPNLPKGSLPIRVEIHHPREGSAAIPYVELRATKRGRKHATLTNEHQNIPLIFDFSWDDTSTRADGRLSFRQARFGRTVQEAREAAAFMLSATRPGSRMRILDIRTGDLLDEVAVPPELQQFSMNAKLKHELLDKLAFIEPRIAAFGSLSLEHGIGQEDALVIEKLYRICREGRIERIDTEGIVFEVQPDTKLRTGEREVTWHPCRMNLLGLEIHLGRVKHTIKDRARFDKAVQEGIAKARSTGKPVTVVLEDLPIIEEFLDWPSPHDHLYDVAVDQGGYFTLAQANAAGFASAEQIETAERVERSAGDVFRFVDFPPSDHEDLVVVWLQTDKKGVFSHDTALALHQLSDILPSGRHVTVPPSWVPPPDVSWDRGTVLHRGNVHPSEVTWLGSIPFTKPLRTLQDCIEKGVSPDLIEQALEEAVQQGMVTRAEAQRLQTARAKSA